MATMTTELLVARVRLSLAKMYLSDLRNNIDFGRCVDGKGAGFPNSNRATWIERIQRIAQEIQALLPAEAAALVDGLTGERVNA